MFSRVANLRLPLFAIAMTIPIAGCLSTSFSRPDVDPETGWRSESASRAQKITGPDIEMYVKASNRISRANDETQRQEFGISIYFVPLTANFEFNPQGVSLLIPGQPRLVPSHFALQRAGNNQGLDIWDCGRYPPHDFGPGPRYPVHNGFCADLYFATRPPPPEVEYALQINQLFRNGGKVSVPELHFKKGGSWVRILSN